MNGISISVNEGLIDFNAGCSRCASANGCVQLTPPKKQA
jgi:hypothetical protein